MKKSAVLAASVLILTLVSLFSGAAGAKAPGGGADGVGGLSWDAPAEAAGAAPAPEGPAPGIPEEMEPLVPRPRMLLYTAYAAAPGDTIGEIAMSHGLNQDTLVSLNNIRNSRLLQIGQVLRIPNQDGILHQVKPGESLEGISARFKVDAGDLRRANELFSDRVNPGSSLFIPGARLDHTELQEINGDLFAWPLRGYVTSRYGYRNNPFGGNRQFHSGLDIGAPAGTPVRAAMSGRVEAAGFNEIMGQYVILAHHSNYRTLYGHLSAIRAGLRPGSLVRTGDRIGDVGSTGLSTGPHLHFTVYKNGATRNPASLMR